MTQFAREPQSTIGARVAAARRNRGMTQRDLAQALGVTSWTVDRIESGGADVGRYLSSIADVTQTSRDWFVGATECQGTSSHERCAGATPRRRRKEPRPRLDRSSRHDPVLHRGRSRPARAANFIDIPIFLVAIGVVATQPPVRVGRWYLAHCVRSLPPSCFSASPLSS